MVEKLKTVETGTPVIVVYPNGKEVQAIFFKQEEDKYYFYDNTLFSFSKSFIEKGTVTFMFGQNDPHTVEMLLTAIKNLSVF